MATTPFSSEFVEKLKAATAWRFESELGPVFTPRFFCCTDPNEMGISEGKEPVAMLELDPNPCLVGDSVAFDGRDSYDPDGSVTGYAFTFEGGTPASSVSDNGTVSWAAAGEFEVTLVVEDGTGRKSSPARAIQMVREPGNSYFIAAEDGVWYTPDGGQSWTAKNTGLVDYDLAVNDLKIDPATQSLADGDKTVWIATDGGIFVSNGGGDSWVEKSPANVSNYGGDSPGPAVDDLRFMQLEFAPDGRLFAIANWVNGFGEERSWVFVTEEAGGMRASTAGAVNWSEV
jgi:hypothetical protein